MTTLQTLCGTVGILLGSLTLGASERGLDLAEPGAPQPVRTVDPQLPREFRYLEGEVRVEIRIDPVGRVVEARVLEASHHALASAAREAVLQWRFEPARMGGEPVEGRLIQPFRFNEGLVVSESTKRVDRLPKARRRVAPELPPPLRDRAGYCDLLLTVDPRGNVVEALVRRSSDPAFEDASLAAARQWKFEPARRDGEMVSCQVLLPFRFGG
jgi:TonB family protein